jgi:hypothetical protein
MVGLVLQFVSFAIFTCVLLFFGYRMCITRPSSLRRMN